MVTAFGDSAKLANAALAFLDNVRFEAAVENVETYAYKRYFQLNFKDLCEVQNNFLKVLGPQFKGPESMDQFMEVWYWYRPPWDAADSGTVCDNDPGLQAHLFQPGGGFRAALTLCPSMWVRPKPVSLEAALLNDCQYIGRSADYHMTAPGATLMHELMHWYKVGVSWKSPFSPGVIMDWNDPSKTELYSPMNDPQDGYGPFVSHLEDLSG